MKPTPYLKKTLKVLDKNLRNLPRSERLEALRVYKYGLEASFYDNYPEKFVAPSEISFHFKYSHFQVGGISDGVQPGPLEVESAREFLLEAVEKRKKKFSKSGFLEELWRLCGSFSEKV